MLRFAAASVLLLILAVATLAEEPDFSAELPRITPVPAEKAAQTFQVQKGYYIELAAAEPLVASPVAICWDERGRMYVVEMRGYSEHRDEKLSRVRLLHDDNNDGVYDRATNFAEGLLWPTAIACWDGGVFVADAPDILYLKDTDNDGQADVKKRVFTGFGTQNVQGLLNTLLWGPDNRIHGSASSNGGQISIVDKPDLKPISVSGRDFSFDPRTLDFRPESGGAQHGMTFDDFGHKFVCSNSDHCQQVMYEDRYVARNPLLAAPSARVSIAADGPQAEVFRISPVEPWRIVRTRLRVAGTVPGPIEGGGRAAGYFTGATGITMVRGSAFADDPLYGMVVVGDVGSNLIHRKKLTLNGLQYTAERVDKESEFVASKDNWFRPAQFANGPDGALYVIDVYREVIEHPASLPPVIKKHLDLDSGRDRGRIWRIAPQKWQRGKLVSLDNSEPRELVRLLEHKNAWQRETASRLLVERHPAEAVPQLAEMAASTGASARARTHALYALAALSKASGSSLMSALQSSEPRLQEHAVRIVEQVWSTLPEADQSQLLKALKALSASEDLFLRQQLAFSWGGLPEADRVAGMSALLDRAEQDRWLRLACMTSLPNPGTMLEHALRREKTHDVPADMLLELAVLVGRSKDVSQHNSLCDVLEQLPKDDELTRVVVLRSLLDGAGLSREAFIRAAGPGKEDQRTRLLTASAAGAQRLVSDAGSPTIVRMFAIRGLSLGELAGVEDQLTKLLTPRQAELFQQESLRALGRFSEPRAAELILAAWPQLAPTARRTALDVLISRPERAKLLLEAIREKDVAATEIDAAHIELLKKHGNAEIREQALKLFGAALARRDDVVQQYRPVLEKSGNAANGKMLFGKKCASCHKVEDVGHELGPNLAAMKNRGAEAILLNVLDPNREVNPQYLNYVAVTNDGKTLSGVVAAESATSITLKRADGQKDEILRSDLEELRSTGLSLMPEGMEKELEPQAMADLIAYLLSLK